MKRKRLINPTPRMFSIADYNPNKYDKESLRKWCIEQAIDITKGDSDTPNVIQAAQKIYDWVTK